MPTFQKVKIKDIAREQRDAYFPSASEDLSYIGLEHIEQQTLRLSDIGKSSDATSQKKKFIAGDVLYGSLRPYFRKVYKPKFDGVCSTDIAVLKPKSNCDNSYLFYLIASPDFISKASGAGNGTKMPRAGWKVVKDFVFDVPDVAIQTRIAGVLSAYDDLIENNEKRIKTLEQIAQLLYTEWFVKFEFPGHEKSKLIDSHTPYGPIPEGWEVKKLEDIANLIMGQSPTSDNYNFEKLGLPFHQGVADFGHKYPIDRVYSNAGNKYTENNDLLFSVRAPVGRMNIANKKIILGRGLCAIRHKQALQSLLFLMFASKFTEKDMIGNGAIYKSVNRAELENIKFVYPTEKIALEFENIVSKYFDEMQKLTILNQTLSQTRDLLIPQLVTGKRELK
ncbi:MAG: restriction endonuclease subunit S [Candidatus Gribaldobacteria bacterium]|nr:restriction endonuclease subunit S [Candidatus Gribaldobacteria bacterium]